MKQVAAIALSALFVGMFAPVGETAPRKPAGHVVMLPPLPMSRQGSLDRQTVSRGLDRGDRTGISPDRLSLPLRTLPVTPRLLPQRNQVLALRKRVSARYHGKGRGARLAIEIP